MRPPISNNLGKQLHDRATRGDILSAEEQTQLEQQQLLEEQRALLRLLLRDRE